jgi:glycosyltransferase involved in cell wall biosynthesis
MAKLTVLIPSFNSESTVRRTLESVRWADEILVCDSGSTDRTLDLAKEYGARILQHEYINSALQKNWAIPQCSHEWVLIVDTDEALEEKLKNEIRALLENPDPEIDGYRIPRKNFMYGKWMRHGIYPDYQLRFFRRDKGRYETREVHAHLKLEGRAGVLNGHFLHEGFKDLRTWMIKFERYIRYEMDELVKQNRKFSIARVTLYPLFIFMRNFLWRRGFLDGYRGFILAILDSFYYFMMYARLYEKERKVG